MSSGISKKRVSRLVSMFENLSTYETKQSTASKDLEIWETTASAPELKRFLSVDPEVIKSVEDVRSEALKSCAEYKDSLADLVFDYDDVDDDDDDDDDEDEGDGSSWDVGEAHTEIGQVTEDMIEILHEMDDTGSQSSSSKSGHYTVNLNHDDDDEPLYMNIDFQVKPQRYSSSSVSISDDDYETIVVQDDAVVKEIPIYENIDFVSSMRRNDSALDLVTMRKRPEDGKSSESEPSCLMVKTIYDSNQNLRMKMVSAISMNQLRQSINKTKKDHIVEELINTEILYLESLQYVVDNYKTHVQENFTNGPLMAKKIFCNLEEIYRQSSDLLKEIKSKRKDYEEIGKAYKRNKNLFDLYPIYCANKKESNRLVTVVFKEQIKKKEEQLHDKLGLNSFLLKPVQRLGKYELLLKNLSKCMKKDSQSTHHVDAAVDIIVKASKRANDLLMLSHISGSPHAFAQTGEFLFQDTFQILRPKRMEMTVFLCKKMVLLTTRDPKDVDSFLYYDSIDKDSLTIVHKQESSSFTLNNYYTSKKSGGGCYKLKAKDFATKEKWTSEIYKILWEQLNSCKEKVRQRLKSVDKSEEVRKETMVVQSGIVLKKSTFYTTLNDSVNPT